MAKVLESNLLRCLHTCRRLTGRLVQQLFLTLKTKLDKQIVENRESHAKFKIPTATISVRVISILFCENKQGSKQSFKQNEGRERWKADAQLKWTPHFTTHRNYYSNTERGGLLAGIIKSYYYHSDSNKYLIFLTKPRAYQSNWFY